MRHGSKIRLWMLAGTLLLAVFLLSACGSHAHEPVAVDEHTDRCAICNMMVADNRHATQIITKDGQPLLFDDIGCMMEWIAKNGRDTIGISFVRDYDSLAWLKMEEAYYVYDPSIRTPMAYGVVSFAEEARAEAFVQELGTGTVLDAAGLEDHTWEANHSHHGEHGHDAHGHDEHEHGQDAHGHGEAAHHESAGHHA